MAKARPKSFEQIRKEIAGKPILVANRGIPARRIARTIQEVLGATAVITATDVDKTSPAMAGARELMLLGADPKAYLDLELILRKAKARGIAAIHPGWGFMSEDNDFPAACQEAGILFIGPDPEPMRKLGNKVAVRKLARKLGVPVVPGSAGAVTIAQARKEAKKIGMPVMLKAEGGGGGRGIYEVFNADELEEAFVKARTMAQAEFGNSRLFVERLLTDVRHIEIQVVADRYGNAIALDERDCTVQRNHQKLVEITPSPWPDFTPELRAELKDYAVRLVKAVGYHTLATVEFLVDADGTPYLIEVNTRLQVEHGITECRYGIDLVEEQIATAFGAKLRLTEENCQPQNHAMQVRVNCENPQDGFSPNAGLITRLLSPGGQGVRLDSCITAGYEFPSQYDSAAALLIGYGRDWKKVLGVVDRALAEYYVGGVNTTIPYYKQIVRHPQFRSGDYNTNFVAQAPELLDYLVREAEPLQLSRLVAEISAKGHNPYVSLGEYRGRADKRIGRLTPVLPRVGDVHADNPYPKGDRDACLDYLRDTKVVHFTDTTTRDVTQSNSGNRFRLAEDRLIGPYLDNCRFFSLENGGGAHFHVALLANLTYPFSEAAEWNRFAPNTLKQILVRSTNVLGYKPQPKNLMRLTAEMVAEHYDVIRCFDFLNHVENMEPFAEVALNHPGNIFEPAISLSWAKGFDVRHYLRVADEMLALTARVAGVSKNKAQRLIILGLKDMAGVCPPRFITELVRALRQKYPELVLHYHRHYTDGLFVPAVGAAAKAGAHIVDTGLGASVRWYGQGDVQATAAYLEGELGLKTDLNVGAIRAANFVLKQVMPYYDRYAAPYFQGVDHDVVEHGMPGGATSSSQEGALKQGYIHLLPYMLRFLAGTRKIVRYHDVTPGSQITWNVAFLAVTGTFKRGGERGVRQLLEVLESIAGKPEGKISAEQKTARLEIYRDANDAFRDLLLGRFGKLPLGFPADWVYQSAFGKTYKKALRKRTERSPLHGLKNLKLKDERAALTKSIGRSPTAEEFVLYLNHPGDALKTIDQCDRFGDSNLIPLDVWFEGLEPGAEMEFVDSHGKPHSLTILQISPPDEEGNAIVRYSLDSEFFDFPVKIAQVKVGKTSGVELAEDGNDDHVAAPSSGDLWVMHVKPGDVVHEGEELFNISIMKQEKAIVAPADGLVKRVLKYANYQSDKKMVPVREGELLVELEAVPERCPKCSEPLTSAGKPFCAACGHKLP